MKEILVLFVQFLVLINISAVFAQDAFFRYVKAPVMIVSSDGQEEVATKESVTEVGDTIKVKEGGLAIVELEDRSTLKIEAGSELMLEELIKEEKEDEYVGASSVILKMGSLFVEVAQKFSDAPSLNIKNTKSIALGVRGTELFAGIDDDNGDFYTSVKSGEVEVYDVEMDDSDSIKAGQSMVVEQGKKITRAANFEWAKRLRWNNNGEEGGSDFRNLRRKARQEFMTHASDLRNRQQRPVGERFRQWQAGRQERRRPQEKLTHLLERRQWKDRPTDLKNTRREKIEQRHQRRQEWRNRGTGEQGRSEHHGRGHGRNDGTDGTDGNDRQQNRPGFRGQHPGQGQNPASPQHPGGHHPAKRQFRR
ncbi:MAG: FecR domain-containing protein [Bdellovibrionota bacterium]